MLNLAITIPSKWDEFGEEDIIKEVKRHSFYLKPGEKKRVKEALARKRSRKKARKEQD